MHGPGECQLAEGVDEPDEPLLVDPPLDDEPEDDEPEDDEPEVDDPPASEDFDGVEDVVEPVLDDFEERESVR